MFNTSVFRHDLRKTGACATTSAGRGVEVPCSAELDFGTEPNRVACIVRIRVTAVARMIMLCQGTQVLEEGEEL